MIGAMRLRLIIHDIRSCHNVGSLLRTAEGLGVGHVYFSGYTPYPIKDNDERLPHLRTKIQNQIHKTALGAEHNLDWSQHSSIEQVISGLKKEGFEIVALEQTKNSIPLPDYHPAGDVAIVLGREVEGVSDDILKLCDNAIEIPMLGNKESFNVVQAAAMALYQCRYFNQT